MKFINQITSIKQTIQASKFARVAKKGIDDTAKNVGQEAKETQEMAQTFFRLLENKLDMENRTTPPNEQEVKEAIEQLKDVGRFTVFAGVSILPGGGFGLIALEMLARKYNISNFSLIPSSFRKKKSK